MTRKQRLGRLWVVFKKIFLLLLIVTSLASCFFFGQRFFLNKTSDSQVLAQASTDWPQLQHDPQRTGRGEQTVPPGTNGYQYLWRFADSSASSNLPDVAFSIITQPVVSEGVLCIGDLKGVMYALEAIKVSQTNPGRPIIRWTYQTGGPIRHTAAIDSGKVYFGSQDTYVYAVNLTDGSLAWRFKTGEGIATAPLVYQGNIYMGSRDGYFYALSGNNGSLLWQYPPKGQEALMPILTSASLSEDGSTIFLGSEDMYAYALERLTGNLLWKEKLEGQSLRFRWPVVIGNSVVYRSYPLEHFHPLLQNADGEVLNKIDPPWDGDPNNGSDYEHTLDYNEWLADWQRAKQPIINYLEQEPWRQSLFVLNTNDGKKPYTAPVLYTDGNNDIPDIPVVGSDGKLYFFYRARHGIQNDHGSVHVTTRYDAVLGKMDPLTGEIEPLWTPDYWNLQYRRTSDEPGVCTFGGEMLFVSNWTRLGGINVSTQSLFEIANVADPFVGYGGQWGGKDGPMPFYYNCIGTGTYCCNSYCTPYPYEYGNFLTPEYTGYSGAVVADGVIYWQINGNGLAAIVPRN